MQSHALVGEMKSVNCEFWRDEVKKQVHKLSHPPSQMNNQLLCSAIMHDSARATWRGCWWGGGGGGDHYQAVAYSDLHI